MTTELQNKVWSILPKEFKEEVKEIYLNAVVHHPCSYNHKTDLLKYLFGRHNLTSKADGEEMLYVEAKTVREMYAANQRIITDFRGKIDAIISDLINHILRQLFGSKCLPDEDAYEVNFASIEPKPAEPKNEGTRQGQCVPKNAESDTHSFNHILKDGFRNERRLNIATQITASIYSDYETVGRFRSIEALVRKALDIADTLISEAEKGGIDGED